VETQQGSHQVQVKLLLFTYNENKWTNNNDIINLFYNKYSSVQYTIEIMTEQFEEQEAPS